ncbi:related to Protein LSM12 [Saccharomycodes ludwigii]|uniref:Related to Protein LSM12 n=1 Tax=Saccharomycodes ludwigii TaxID=36035 RepID=A0A376B1I7_9ASCO|nr:hypothetical protein SCDLUD_002876 [Saccharomycodes ludwigii]KAH3901384.1 hypothetical protein SCDLUD_002876 [Saccharomycodes ludwigii]SSD58502.1 related to Protein LSM12 [Saccharomycodes ludwigii]
MNLDNIIGVTVKVTNLLGKETIGRIYSFNSESGNITILTSGQKQNSNNNSGSSNSNNNGFSFKIFKISFIKSIEFINNTQSSVSYLKKHPLKPHYVDLERVKNLLDEQVKITGQRDLFLGKNVTKEGQFIFDKLHKTISEIKWDNRTKDIILLEEVKITPPYKVKNIQAIAHHNNDSVEFISKIVVDAWEKLDKEQINSIYSNKEKRKKDK